MISIYCDKAYTGSLWGQSLLCSLREQLRLKRLPFCEITDTCGADTDAVFLVASDYEWTRDAVLRLNGAGLRPILLCNQISPLPGCTYSCVCSDVHTTMRTLMEALRQKKITRTALYGVNRSSLSDRSYVDSLHMWYTGGAESVRIFENDGSLSACFSRFYREIDNFDAVICVNNFAALSLLLQLEERRAPRRQELTIVSCVESHITDLYRDRILSLQSNFDQYGRAAVMILEAMQKNPTFSTMTVSIARTLPDAPAAPMHLPLRLPAAGSDNMFYRDPALREMMIVDKLLTLSDGTDRQIIRRLLDGTPLPEIADACYMAEGSVKYRLRRMLAYSGAADREELLALWRRYVPRQ